MRFRGRGASVFAGWHHQSSAETGFGGGGRGVAVGASSRGAGPPLPPLSSPSICPPLQPPSSPSSAPQGGGGRREPLPFSPFACVKWICRRISCAGRGEPGCVRAQELGMHILLALPLRAPSGCPVPVPGRWGSSSLPHLCLRRGAGAPSPAAWRCSPIAGLTFRCLCLGARQAPA